MAAEGWVMSSKLARWEFEERFRAKVRHAVETARKTGAKPNLKPLPSERANATRLLARGQLHPLDMAKWVDEEVASVLQ